MNKRHQNHGTFRSRFSSSVLVWVRQDLPREAALDYWRSQHAQLVARARGRHNYRQHHFSPENAGLWPDVPRVETAIPARRRVDGLAEVTFDGISGPLQGGRFDRLVHQDEANVFGRTICYLTTPHGGRWYDVGTGARVGCRVVVFLRRASAIRTAAFRRYVHDLLGPILAKMPQVQELRSQVFAPWHKALWDTPGVAHDHPRTARFHAMLVLGFKNEDTQAQFFAAPALNELATGLPRFCTAVHAYRVARTYTYVVDGRPTLPQCKPERKPRLDPVRRILPAAPPRAFKQNGTTPVAAIRQLNVSGYGPEDVVVDRAGRLVCGVADGRILRLDPASGAEEVLGDTGGRPLGLEVVADGTILICDAHRGLLRLDPRTSTIEPLVQYIGDVPLRFCSNVTAADDGTLWFTESSSRFDFEHYMGALYEHRPAGRLFRRDPDGRVDVVLEDLHFANGLTLTEDESSVIFAETDGYRLSRLWLKGPKRGQRDVLVDNLPGFPDNVSRSRDGRFWVALVTPRNPLLDRLGRSPAWVRKLLWRMPDRWIPRGGGTVWAMAFDEAGRLVADVQTPRADYYGVTGVVEANGSLYLASVAEPALLQITLPQVTLLVAGHAAREAGDASEQNNSDSEIGPSPPC